MKCNDNRTEDVKQQLQIGYGDIKKSSADTTQRNDACVQESQKSYVDKEHTLK